MPDSNKPDKPTTGDELESAIAAVATPELAETLEKLDDKQREVIIQQIQSIEERSFRGPLPPPDVMRGYEDIVPGAADRILAMAEKEQQHRFDCEKKIIKGSIFESRLGQWFAFTLSVLFLGAALWLGLAGHDELAGVVAGTTLVSIVAIFIAGQKGKTTSPVEASAND